MQSTVSNTTKKIVHRADSRGGANHGWLKTFHSFSFASWYDPNRMNFGALRVLNDDHVAPGMGFDFHPHADMEIISIPLKGALRHRDNMGTEAIINSEDVQIMSAGTGVYHEEQNASRDEDVKFLQVWVFPKYKDLKPRYDQKTFDPADRVNTWQPLIAPEGEIEHTISITQDAWFSRTNLDAGKSLNYDLKGSGTGVYLLVLEGEIEVAGETLSRRDAMGLSNLSEFDIKANESADVLLIEVAMYE